jgi:hypothetical protein
MISANFPSLILEIDCVYQSVLVPHTMSEKLASDLFPGTSLTPIEYIVNARSTCDDESSNDQL